MNGTHVTFYPFKFKEEIEEISEDEIRKELEQLQNILENIECEIERGEQNADT